MDKKFKVESPGEGKEVKVRVVGIDDIIADIRDSEALIALYDRFVEHVTLCCVMPEIPRYTINDKRIDDTGMSAAYEYLDTLLVRYRKITSWMRLNGIDIEAIVGKDNGKSKS